jgi:hypothetical protein
LAPPENIPTLAELGIDNPITTWPKLAKLPKVFAYPSPGVVPLSLVAEQRFQTLQTIKELAGFRFAVCPLPGAKRFVTGARLRNRSPITQSNSMNPMDTALGARVVSVTTNADNAKSGKLNKRGVWYDAKNSKVAGKIKVLPGQKKLRDESSPTVFHVNCVKKMIPQWGTSNRPFPCQ